MIFSFKVKTIVCAVLLIVFGVGFSLLIVNINNASASSLINYTIVLDAGHGLPDGGSVGVNTGITEEEVSLSITKQLEQMLLNFGFKVVLTRTNSQGLHSAFADNRKIEDMEKRNQIINDANADMVISIHLNSWPNEHQSGAQAFYQSGSDSGQMLAEAIQGQMQNQLVNARELTIPSDLYILQCTNNPSVVVETGFLSNPAEEALLSTTDYQQKVAYSIFCGIIKFFETSNQV